MHHQSLARFRPVGFCLDMGGEAVPGPPVQHRVAFHARRHWNCNRTVVSTSSEAAWLVTDLKERVCERERARGGERERARTRGHRRGCSDVRQILFHVPRDNSRIRETFDTVCRTCRLAQVSIIEVVG